MNMKLLYGILICCFIAVQGCVPSAEAEHVCSSSCTEGTHKCGEHCGCGDGCECSEGATCSSACDLHHDE